MSEERKSIYDRNVSYGLWMLVLIGLYLSSLYNYLLFHSLAEVFSILVAGSMFMIAWNSKKYIENPYLIFIAIAYLFIGFLDLLHTLSYKGMQIFTDYDYYANQLWIGARGMESLTLLVAFFFLRTEKKVWPEMLFAVYALISALLISSVFWWKIFPVCFVPGKGQTVFKISSEYVICGILLIDMWLLFRYRNRFEEKVFDCLLWSLAFTIGSELAFTFYISNYGFSNLVGHYFKIFSFYLIYKAIIETAIVRPYDIIFRELISKEQNFREARKAADAANHAKSEFLAHISHELRTPLNGILGYAQILKKDRSLRESQKAGIDIIERSGNHLLNLLNDILDLSKVEAGKMELCPMPLAFLPFLKGICEMVSIRAGEKGLDFRYEISPSLPYAVLADEQRLGQVLLNLLNNAIKFTDAGSVIFSVEPIETERKNGFSLIRFQVKDTGLGIPEDHLENIFSPFRQVAAHRHKTKGTGLGLTITRNLVRLMGGEISVQSELKKGSVFRFDLKLPKASDAEETKDKAEKGTVLGFQGETRKILVVDDKKENRSLIRDILSPLGFEITEAENGSDGVAKTAEFMPDLIFMDLIMPVMDGFEATARIRQLAEIVLPCIIALSADIFDDARNKSLTAGCDDYVSKPFVMAQILEKVRGHLHLEWIYEENVPRQESACPVSAAPVPLPADMLAVLKKMAEMGDIGALRDKSEEMLAGDAQFRAFAKQLRQLTKTFDIDRIQVLLEKCGRV